MKKLLLAGFLSLVAGIVCAQDFKTGYFLENYTYSYRINPGASLDDKPCTFFGVGIGNVTANVNSNLSLSSFLHQMSNGENALFFDSAVSLEDAVAGFAPDNSLLLNANVNLVTFGRQTDHNRFSVEINARSDSYLNLPLGFISSSKRALEGLATKNWDNDFEFSGLQADANMYTEIAFGYSQKLGDAFTVGGRVKGLIGLADISGRMDADVHLRNVTTSDETVSGKLDGSVALASPVELDFARYKNNYDLYATNYGQLFDDLLHGTHRKVAGWGAAIDLGATFEPFDGLSISASLLDLGFINWKSTLNGVFVFDKTIKTGEVGEDTGSEIFSLEDTEKSSYTTKLNYTFHAGVKYKMPFYDKLSVGLLGTLQQNFKEIRLGANIAPVDFLSVAASGAITTYGGDFGLALNIRAPFLDFFVGSDAIFLPGPMQSMMGKKLNTLLTAGLVITI